MIRAERDDADERRIKITGTSPLHKDLMNTIPGCRWSHKQSAWHVPLGWASCLALRSTFRHDLEIGPELAKWAQNELETRIKPCLALRTATEADGSPSLYGYQRAGVAFLATAKRALCADEMGTGKAQPISEPVLTPSGFKPMGDIKQGDYVIGSNGQPTRVTGVFPQGVRPIYRVSFSDGTFANADAEHLWSVKTTNDVFRGGKSRILTTQEMLDQGVLTNPNHRGERNSKWRIPIAEAAHFDTPVEPLPIDPYTLGVLLGDGSIIRDVGFCSIDDEIIERVVESLPADLYAVVGSDKRSPALRGVAVRSHKAVDHRHSAREALKHLGLFGRHSHDKFVPQQYLHASIEDRLELLRGLMDTDGSADKRGLVGFSSASEQLANDVAFLVRSLGGRANRYDKPTPKGGNYPVYSVGIIMPSSMNPFYLSRKAERVGKRPKYKPTKFIRSIEYSHDEEAQCIAVAASDHLYVTRDFVVTHNTRQALMALQQLYMQGTNPFPSLIVAPNSTKISWKREAETVWPGLEVIVIKGSAAQRRKQLETPAHIYVMNWESVRGHSRLAPYGSIGLARCPECGGEDQRITHTKCEVHERELNQLKFNSVICDEAHRMKDPKAKQTRAVWAATGDADIRFALTGTPIASTPDDLWTILHWLSPEEWPSRSRYVERMLDVSYNAFGAPTVIGVKPHMQEEFFAALDPRMRRMPKSVVLKHLPPVLFERRDVEMTPKQAKAYRQMVDQMIAELDDGELLVTTSPLVRVTRLLQFASSYAEIERTWDEKKEAWEELVRLAPPSCKIDAFMDDLPDFGDDQIVVFAVSRQLIELLSDKLTKKGIEHGLITGAITPDQRQQYMDDFQAGKIKLMLCTIQAGGTGITLTKARVGVFLQRSWSMIDNIQAEARVHRIGSEQHDSVVIVDYVTAGTVEETVIGAVEQKNNRLEEILRDKDLLRKVLEEGDDK